MNADTPVRKLPSNHIEELSRILDKHDTWKKLFGIIPDDLNASLCNPQGYKKRYNKEHFDCIEKANKDEYSSKSLAFLNHWINVGKHLPTLHHLKLLLIEAKLFHAADYVCVQLLHEAIPRRPDRGAARSILLDVGNQLRTDDLENALGEMNYASELIERNEDISYDININHTNTGSISVDKSLNLELSVPVNQATTQNLDSVAHGSEPYNFPVIDGSLEESGRNVEDTDGTPTNTGAIDVDEPPNLEPNVSVNQPLTQNVASVAEHSESYNFPVIDLNLEESSRNAEDMDGIPNMPNLSSLQQSSERTVMSTGDCEGSDRTISTNSVITSSELL